MRHLIITTAALFLAACPAEVPDAPEPEPVAEPAPAPEPAVDEGVAKAAALAAAIKASPETAEALLAEHGTTQAELEALLFEIAADPARSAAYAAALE